MGTETRSRGDRRVCGLSRAPGLTEDLTRRLAQASLGGFPIPAIRVAQGCDASGARGAALHALNEAKHA